MSLICVVAHAASTPSIETVTYNALTGEVVITGTALSTSQAFALSSLTFSGENGESYTLQDANDPAPSNSTTVSFTLSNNDHLSLSRILNKNGTSPENGSPYNLSTAQNFNGSATADSVATLVVSNFRTPALISATYNASSGVLHFTGEGFRAIEGVNNDVTASKISIIGEGGNSSAYALTNTQNVDVISVTEFLLPLHVDDNLYVYSLLNKDGASADDDTIFYFSVSDDWMSGGNSAENLAQRGGLAGNTVTLSAADNQASETLVVSGVNNAGYFVPLSSVSGNYGTYSINASGQWTYQINTSAVPGLAAGTTAIDTFNVTGNDSAVYNVVVTITGQNDAPVATNDSASTNEDTQLQNINVLANDTDIDGDSLTVSGTPVANSGVVAVNGDNTLTYTPDANFNGTDTLTYTITDGDLTDTATVTITVTAVNDAPVATDDTASTNEDTQLQNINVLANDTDVEGDSLSVSGTPAANSGVVAVNGDNTLTYTPDANFNGSDTLTYTVTDGNLTDTATVTVTVTAINDAPVAANDTAATNEDIPLQNINVLVNDTDVDGDNLSVSGTPTANSGVVTVNGDNTLDYTPDANFNGTDTITYSITDGNLTDTATVTVTVAAVNDAPVATNDTASTNEDTPLQNINVLANDTDVDGDNLSVSGAPAANSGVVTVNGDNTLTYTPNANFNGTDTITYIITDGADTNTANVTIAVTAVNDVPVANDDTASANEDTLLNINVLANDVDVDGDSLSVSGTPTANSGVVSIKPDNTLDYTPNVNFNGTDTITYTITDGNLTDKASVTVTVNAVNDTPTYADKSASIAENSVNGTSVTTMTATDVDTGDTLTYSFQTNSAGIFAINSATGAITIGDNSSLNYESATQHQIVVKVTDSNGATATANGTIDVTNVEETQTPTITTSFGNAGIGSANSFAADDYNEATDTLIDASGRIIVSSTTAYSGSAVDIGLTRFNSDGSLDFSFGVGGVVNKDLGGEERVNAIAFDTNGNILVAGTSTQGGISQGFIARYTSAGQLDTSFNSTGYRLLSDTADLGITDMVLDGADNIYLSGTTLITLAGITKTTFTLVKVAANGGSHESISPDISGCETCFSFALAIELQSDGKVLLIGFENTESNGVDFAIARFNVTPGLSLDTTYGTNGAVLLDLGSELDDYPRGSHLLASGELIVSGSSFISKDDANSGFASVKLNANGDLVNSFGSAGILRLAANTFSANSAVGMSVLDDDSGNLLFAVDVLISSNGTVIYKTNSNGVAQSDFASNGALSVGNSMVAADIDLDAQGRLLLTATKPVQAEEKVFLTRFTSAGVLDTSFSADGSRFFGSTYATDVLSEMIGVTTSPNAGKYLLVGNTTTGGQSACIIAQFNSDGSVDTAFGEDGYFVLSRVESEIVCTDVAEYSDGSLFAVGIQDGDGLVIRLTASGQLDTRFDSDGIKLSSFDFSGQFNSIAIDESNRIVLAGQVFSSPTDGILVRMDSTGTLDTTFSGDGKAQIDLGLGEEFKDMRILSDNSIMVVGQRGKEALVAKFLNDGSLDTSGFNAPDGYVSVDLDPVASANDDSLNKLLIHTDGKIFAAGSSTDGISRAAFIQLTSDGALDTNFSSDGITTITPGSGTSEALDIVFDASERPVIVGKGSNGSNDDIFISRLTASGTVDTLFNTTGSKLFDYGANESANTILINADGSLVIAGSDDLNLYPTSFFFIQKIQLVEP